MAAHTAAARPISNVDFNNVWSVGTVEEGIEVLTGLPAGKNEDGSFALGGVFARVDQRLVQMAEEMARFNREK